MIWKHIRINRTGFQADILDIVSICEDAEQDMY